MQLDDTDNHALIAAVLSNQSIDWRGRNRRFSVAVKLAEQLSRESARSAFTQGGQLSQGAISGARQIIAPGTMGNPAIPSGFGKYATETFASPSGPFQVHFYMNPKTGEVLYGLDYKVVFNTGL